MISIEATLDRFAAMNVLVVGDVMLDRFVYGDVRRISPEAPTPVLQADHHKEMLGGAGNVATNLTALGGRCVLIGLIGTDEAGETIRRLIATDDQLSDGTIRDGARCTTLKVRFVSPHHNTHLLRADWEVTTPVEAPISDELLERVKGQLDECEAIILSDYGKGVLTPSIITAVIDLALAAGKPVIVDPKGRDYARYSGATVVTPNVAELSLAVERTVLQTDHDVEAGARALLARTGIGSVVIKRSEFGAQIVERERPSEVIPPAARRVVDVSGAGDTFVATLTLALAAGADLHEAGRIGNSASGLVVEKRGTASVSVGEIREFLIPRPKIRFPRKIVTDLSSLKALVRAWREDSLTVGFANGCFDLLHPGHVYLLSEARTRVDRLLVALNSDASVCRLKGEGRPLQNESARLSVMAALEAVDAVTLFSEDTPYSLIREIQPDVLFKGSDYAVQDVVGHDLVEASGGRVELIELVPDNSTTGIVRRMNDHAGHARLATEHLA